MLTMRRIEARYWPVDVTPRGCWFGIRSVPHVHETYGRDGGMRDPIVIRCEYATERAA